MNILLLIVLIILISSIIWGWWCGFVRIIFSIITMIFTITLVSWINPHTIEFIKQNTTIYEKIAVQCTKKIQSSVEETFSVKTKEELCLEMQFPKLWKQQFLEIKEEFIEEKDIYKQAGEYVADKILQGTSFIVSFIVISLLLKVLFKILNLISKLPIINGLNRLLGGIMGGMQGFFIVWTILFLVTLFYMSPIGQISLIYINESTFLIYLYECNPINYLLW